MCCLLKKALSTLYLVYVKNAKHFSNLIGLIVVSISHLNEHLPVYPVVVS